MTDGNGPLNGIRVIDLGRHQAGPRCAQVLARLGAEVIKIERLGGEETRYHGPWVRKQSAYWVQYNSGKKSVSMDLRKEDGKTALRKLIKVSDVVVQNFRPGTIDERGRPTTDAGAARRGALLPFGGHKGYALALAMHALGVSAKYLFIAFKPDLFVPLEDYRRSLAAEIAAIKATPRQDGVSEIRIPGERAYRERARLSREGIEIDRRIHDALIKLAEGRQ